MADKETNVPAVEITDTGVSVPETGEIYEGVLNDYNDAFGGGLNIESASTPQAYLAQEQTACMVDMNAAIAYLFNNVDPTYASGRFQDAIARIYFISRKGATSTTVTALCTGSPGVTLPAGSQAMDMNGYTYTSTTDAVFDSTGQATVTFVCDTAGAISCGVGSLTQILVAVPGWDAITNEAAGVVGEEEENRQNFEYRRYQSVADNAIGTVPAVRSAVLSIDDVLDCYVIDNPTGETVYKGETEYPLKPHSIYVGVVGGDDDEVAKTIWTKKDVGCDYNGNTTVTVYDDTALVYPYPEYDVTFNRPDNVAIKFKIELASNDNLQSNVEALVKDAIVSAFNGENEGFTREKMGNTIFASRYYSVVSSINDVINILSILIGIDEATENSIVMGIDQYPTVSESDIEVVFS